MHQALASQFGLVHVLAAPLSIQLPLVASEGSEVWLKSLGPCTLVGDSEEVLAS